MVREGLLQGPRRAPVGHRGRDPARLPEAGQAVPPRRQPGGSARRAVQGDLGRLRRAVRPREAQGLRRGPPAGPGRGRVRRLRGRRARGPTGAAGAPGAGSASPPTTWATWATCWAACSDGAGPAAAPSGARGPRGGAAGAQRGDDSRPSSTCRSSTRSTGSPPPSTSRRKRPAPPVMAPAARLAPAPWSAPAVPAGGCSTTTRDSSRSAGRAPMRRPGDGGGDPVSHLPGHRVGGRPRQVKVRRSQATCRPDRLPAVGATQREFCSLSCSYSGRAVS